MPLSRPAVRIALVGTVAVLAYAVVAALQILVWNPRAAVPGRTLAQIRSDVAAAGESLGTAGTLVVLGGGVALAVSGLVVILPRAAVQPSAAVILYLVMLVLGAPAYFIASFAPGMSLADTYGISGGDHAPGAQALYALSALAALALLVAVVRLAVRGIRSGGAGVGSLS